ncbi:MAG: TetR/AcrR family transcriptional regulator [Acidimicrobiales bacterium]
MPGADVAVDARRLTRQGLERKQQLLDQAAELFAERGYSETRVIDIVRAAGVAKGLFYWYFENKEAVFRELIDRTRHQMRQYQAVAIDPDADALTRIMQGSQASVMFMGAHRRLYSIFEIESVDADLTTALRQGGDVHVHDTARHVEAGIVAGLIRNEDPTVLAHYIVGTVGYLSHQHRLGRVPLTLEELAGSVGRLIVRGVAATEELALAAEAAQTPPVALPAV